jgi:hypothetical protein
MSVVADFVALGRKAPLSVGVGRVLVVEESGVAGMYVV